MKSQEGLFAEVLYRIMSLQMLSKRSLSVIAFVSCVHLIYGQLSDFSGPYNADAAQLDFIYHNHEEMTNYLRLVLLYLFYWQPLLKSFNPIFSASCFVFRQTAFKYPNLTALYSIGKLDTAALHSRRNNSLNLINFPPSGKSVQGRDLWVMVVSRMLMRLKKSPL